MLECFIQDPVRRKVLQAIDKEFGRVIVNSRMGQGKRPHEFGGSTTNSYASSPC